jgi:hypothetical protein
VVLEKEITKEGEKTHHETCVEAIMRVQFWSRVASKEEIFIYEVDCGGFEP